MAWESNYYRTILKRVITTAIILLVVVFALVYFARAYTYEGELDPEVFNSWPHVSWQAVWPGLFLNIVTNPDPDSPIKGAALYVNYGNILVGYLYWKHGEPHVFKLDLEQDKYVRRHLTEADKQGCMNCHKDKGQGARIEL